MDTTNAPLFYVKIVYFDYHEDRKEKYLSGVEFSNLKVVIGDVLYSIYGEDKSSEARKTVEDFKNEFNEHYINSQDEEFYYEFDIFEEDGGTPSRIVIWK
jgi:hypothetical protein